MNPDTITVTDTVTVVWAFRITLIILTAILAGVFLITATFAVISKKRSASDTSNITASFAFNVLTWWFGIAFAILIGWGLAEAFHAIINHVLQPNGEKVWTPLRNLVEAFAIIGWIFGIFVSAVFIGYAGFKRIDPVHRAYIEFLARRLPWPILGEGWIWIPPYLSTTKAFSMETFRIPMVDDIEGAQTITITTKDNVVMEVSGSVLLSVQNPYLASFHGSIPKEVGKRFGDTLFKAVRSETLRFDHLELPQQKENIANNLRNSPDPATYEGDIKQHVSFRAANEYGIDMREIAITGIDQPKSIKEALEKQAEERSTSEARNIEMQGMIERAHRLVAASKGKLSFERAFNRVLNTEGDKGNNVKIFEGLDGGKNPIIVDINPNNGG